MTISLGLALPIQKTYSIGRDVSAAANAAEEIGAQSGLDRLLGTGLKYNDRFTHTHLGDRPDARQPGRDRQTAPI